MLYTLLTGQQLAEALSCPSARAENWVGVLNTSMERFEINTPLRCASFIAQIGYESTGLSKLEEGLNYSAPRMLTIFHEHFTPEEAERYQHHPEAIANRVYAGHMGNGDELSGDGFRYRGRGLIQLTGKNNYKACGDALGIDLVTNPDLLLEHEHAAMAAAWFWQAHGCNELADVGKQMGITKRINGGVNGLEERIALFNQASVALG